MSVLLIDAGNSRIKWQWRDGHAVRAEGAVAHAELTQAGSLFPVECEQVLVASVRDNTELHEYLHAHYGARLHWLAQPVSHHPEFIHCYPQPARLGVDRWLAMLGARCHYSGHLIVADAGTALTVDLMSADNHHEGGFIVPGLQLAQQALFNSTQRVRPYTDEQAEQHLLPGQDTVSCVSAGAYRQQLALVRSVQQDYPQHVLVITGGDGFWLATQLGCEYRPDLVFDGMDSLCAGSFSP
ncbi:type III pantothenate kinase [Thalassolituus pacificus]|uniref:Type III pantothenate kinase n=1 Tax=Thalassolituus pacificus TaxID=2975440 RepID=A0A9X2WFK2_9GAMM|nr:type III pantothenate kinase [Thalassolituus pacificus]